MKITEDQYLIAESIYKLNNPCNCRKCIELKENIFLDLEDKKMPMDKIFRYKPYLKYVKFVWEFSKKYFRNPTYFDYLEK
jgi:hypothetical protein